MKRALEAILIGIVLAVAGCLIIYAVQLLYWLVELIF